MNRFPFLGVPFVFLLPGLLFASSHPHAHPHSAAPSTILHDVAVIDVATGRVAPHRDILISSGRISRIRPAGTRERGQRYVIPALWDMHVQVAAGEVRPDRYLVSGVAFVRDMGSDLKRIRAMQARISRGEIAGPRIFASGAAVSDEPAAPGSNMPVNVIRTPDDARRAFDSYYDQRVDLIGILSLDARSFEALAERSRQDGVPFAGFVPDSVPANLAAEDRMVSMERLSGIGLACSSRQDELRAKLIAAKTNRDETAIESVNREIEDSYDPAAAATLFDLLRRYGIRQTPSLTWWAREGNGSDYEFAAKLTREMAREGVPILAGTGGGEPGTELHHELELLVSAGLSPVDALRAATIEPARLMRRDDLGQVKQGFEADLLVLRANPLADIRNTRAIDEVIVRGGKFDRAK